MMMMVMVTFNLVQYLIDEEKVIIFYYDVLLYLDTTYRGNDQEGRCGQLTD